jgi:hypothetical protein
VIPRLKYGGINIFRIKRIILVKGFLGDNNKLSPARYNINRKPINLPYIPFLITIVVEIVTAGTLR